MRPLRPLNFTIRLVALSGAALLAGAVGCSLGGLVFDIPSGGAGGETGSSVSGSGSNTGGAAQSSGAAGGPEICTNGSDDDGDGQIDCIDLDCAQDGYSCIDPIPVDWTGPVLFYHGDAASMPACPAGYPITKFQGGYNLSYKDADCNTCSCTSASLNCVHPDIGVFTDTACTDLAVTYNFTPTSGTACGPVSMEAGYGFGAGKPTVAVTGCKPQGGGADLPPATFLESALVCAAEGAGTCASGDQVCAAGQPDTFHGGSQCIFREGDHECPAPFDDYHLLGTEGAFDDYRSCSACACTSPDQFGCDLSYTLYSDATCTTSVLTFPADETCTAAATGVTAASYKAAFSFNGSCTASGGDPEGGVYPIAPVTVCCTF
jgi:hypothetical protein